MFERKVKSTLKKSKSFAFNKKMYKSQKQLSLLENKHKKFPKDTDKPKMFKDLFVKLNDDFKNEKLNEESFLKPFIKNKNLLFFNINYYNNIIKKSKNIHENLKISNNSKQKTNSSSINSYNTCKILTDYNNSISIDKKQNKRNISKLILKRNIKGHGINYINSYLAKNPQNKVDIKRNKTLNDLSNLNLKNNKNFGKNDKRNLKDVSFNKCDNLKKVNFKIIQNIKNNLSKENKNNNRLTKNFEVNNNELHSLNNFKELVYKNSLKDEKINKNVLEFIFKIKKLINELDINKNNKIEKDNENIDIRKILNNKHKIFKMKMQKKDKIIQYEKQMIFKIRKQLYDKDNQINELKKNLRVLDNNKMISIKYKTNEHIKLFRVINKNRNSKEYLHNKTYSNDDDLN